MGGPRRAARFWLCYSLTLLFRCAASSFLMSSGVSLGRSIVSEVMLISPVYLNGTCLCSLIDTPENLSQSLALMRLPCMIW